MSNLNCKCTDEATRDELLARMLGTETTLARAVRVGGIRLIAGGQSNAVGAATRKRFLRRIINSRSGATSSWDDVVFNGEDATSISDPLLVHTATDRLNELHPSMQVDYCWAGASSTGFENGIGSWASGGALRTELVGEVGNYSAISATADRPTVMFWNQGENDAALEIYANAYVDQMSGLIDELVAIEPIDQLVMVRIHKDAKDSVYPALTTLRAAQEELTRKYQFVSLINVDDLQLMPDEIHYDLREILEITERFLEAIGNVRTS